MRDFLKRLLIAGIMAFFISLLFIGVKHPQAANINEINNNTEDYWMWPTDGVVTDTYGTRKGRHHGIDIAGQYGTSIFSVEKGVVTKSYYSNSYGHVVFVKHPNNLETVYAHLSKRAVQEGQAVNKGQIIGEMGSTGRSSGVHLHFEIHKNEWTVNKENALNPVKLLGNIEVGENVQALDNKKEMKKVAGVMEMANTSVEIFDLLPKDEFEHIERRLKSEEDVTQPEKDLMENDMKVSGNVAEQVHIVKKGDNLWDIAQKYESTVDELMQKNKLDTILIFPEQELVVE